MPSKIGLLGDLLRGAGQALAHGPKLAGGLPASLADSLGGLAARLTEGLAGAGPITGFAPVERRSGTRQTPADPGTFSAGQFTNGAGTRPYKLYVPASHRGRPGPLVVMLHGCSQSPDDFAAGTRMNAAAERLGCIVLYPAQTNAANSSRCWNWFQVGDQARGKGEPSLIAGMARQIMRSHAVDERHVYVAGLSAGGATAAIMGETYPDLFAAVCVHSGLACGAAHDLGSALQAMRRGEAASSGTAANPLPTIVFHGDRDHTVNPLNAAQVIAHAMPSETLQRVVSEGQVPGGHSYEVARYLDRTGRSLLERWTVHGGTHGWSGGSPDGSYTDPLGPDATAEMLRFFVQHTRRA